MFRETFKGASWELQRYLKEVKRLLKGVLCCVKDVLRKFQGCLKRVSSVFQENVPKNFKGVVVALISSQLPEQKEGLFFFLFKSVI